MLARRPCENLAIGSEGPQTGVVEFGILGAVVVRQEGVELDVGGPKPRALLAVLLLRANAPVSRDRLIETLWGERAPASAGHNLDSYVSRLRKALGAERIERQAPGYLLRVGSGELDLERFEALLEQGRAAAAVGDPAAARDALDAALALWRGPALADLLCEPFASSEAERLEERRLLALEERIDADLALGGGSELVPELERLVAEHPFRERLLGQLMLALYRSGRQAEALAAYQACRKRLAEELGLEPSPQLQELEHRVLVHDPALAAPRRPRRPTARSGLRRVPLVPAALALAAVAVSAGIGVALGTRGTHASVREASSSQVVEIGAGASSAGHSTTLEATPAAVTTDGASLWLAEPDAGAVVRVDPASHQVVQRIAVGGEPGALATSGGSIWVASVQGSKLTRIDPKTETVVQSVGLGGATPVALASGAGGLWIADATDESLLELDPSSGSVERTMTVPFQPTALTTGGGEIWAADYSGDSVAEVDPRSGQTIASVRVGTGPSALAAGLGGVWVANALDETVSEVDPASGSVVSTIAVGNGPDAVAIAGGSVWVANQYSATVSRIDPRRNVVVGTVSVGGGPTALAAAAGRVWVGTRSLLEHRGGTLTLLHTRPLTIDPALQGDLLPLQSDGLTRDGLVSWNHVAGPAGTQLVPDLAVKVPVPSDGGTAYTFRLRRGIRYSDGRLVRAADFRGAFERLFRLRSQARLNFTGLVGASRCTEKVCDLSKGIATDEAARTVTFYLREPDPGFLGSLTAAAATPVPPGTSFHDVGTTPIPGTGPYEIASASKREIRWVRNPHFHEWSHAAQPDGNPNQIVMRFGLSPEQEVREVEGRHADWLADNVPAALLPRLETHFAGQLHSVVIPTTDFFQLNTRTPPFNDVRVRQALNFALDRRAIVRIYGGRDLAAATCQVLPPGVLGYSRYCPYTRDPNAGGTWKVPDLPRARRLVAASGTRGTRITVWGWTDDPTISPRVVTYTAALLRRLGYRARVRLVPHAFFDHPPSGVFGTIQLIATSWGDNAYGFFATWFACRGPYNHGNFCEARIDRQNLRARTLAATNPRQAAALWAQIDRDLVDQAASAPFINERAIDFVSARVRNYQSHPYWGIIADQLWLR